MDRRPGWTAFRIAWTAVACDSEFARVYDQRRAFADNRRARLRAKRAARLLLISGFYRQGDQREWLRRKMHKNSTFTVFDWRRP